MEIINYSIDDEVSWDKFYGNDEVEEVVFDVKKYIIYGDEILYVDNLPADNPYEYSFQSGNYAILTNSGYYWVTGLPGASADGARFVIYIPEDGDVTPSSPQEPISIETAVITAASTSSNVLVDGELVSFEAYNINNNNYFKLRDIAMTLNETEKQFEVSWDAENNAISITTDETYTSVGGELLVSEVLGKVEAEPTTSKIYIDGQEVSFVAYNINGNNYFKLRDVAKALDFGVIWNGETNTIGIDTSITYEE